MLRFGIRSLLISVAVVAVWLSTIVGYESARDVRSLIMLSVAVASGVAAISYDGKLRAFWAGFFLVLLTTVLDGKPLFVLPWVKRMLNAYGLYQNLPNGFINHKFIFLDATIQAVVLLLIATVMGFLGVLVCGVCRQTK